DKMLKRELWNELINWKNRDHHPLIIKGLRQTGKTFLVKQFGKEYYENTVYLDLRQNTAVHDAFSGNFVVDDMIMSITATIPGVHFVPKKTLIIFDEIQDCPNARSSLKYWDQDGRFDVLATGSFLGVKGFRDPYPRGIPVGYEEQLTLHPLSFREFLINAGIDQKIIDYVEKSVKNLTTIEKAVHQAFRSLYLQYIVVGGMPEVVKSFFELHDLNEVRTIQQRIVSSIRDDFGRYKDKNGQDKINEVLKLRAEACLDSLPSQLSRDYKKFKYSQVNVKGNSPEKADGLQYLEDVGLVIRAYNTAEISFPLGGVKIPSEFKVYYADTGLLISQLDYGTAKAVLSGDLSSYKGAIAENMVACAFYKQNIGLYYYHASTGSPELDFLTERDGDVVIIECKSTNNRATSMKYVLANTKKYGFHPAIKLSDTNIGGGNGFDTLPLYAASFLSLDATDNIIPEIDISGLTVPTEE
ncbi:MAG: AAA family ATPase, partial [Lachnospiraceae bacterium]|nr:AAA family ATPase [Lachnospiraceae bacterium]